MFVIAIRLQDAILELQLLREGGKFAYERTTAITVDTLTPIMLENIPRHSHSVGGVTKATWHNSLR